jgi:hypothetical protein
MKRVEVIADDEEEIIEATRRMSQNYDFVVTSGGIGPTYVYLPSSLLFRPKRPQSRGNKSGKEYPFSITAKTKERATS